MVTVYPVNFSIGETTFYNNGSMTAGTGVLSGSRIAIISVFMSILACSLFGLFLQKYGKGCYNQHTKEREKPLLKRIPDDIEEMLDQASNQQIKANFGKISYSMNYHYTKGVLEINVIQLEDLFHPVDNSFRPYVSIQVKTLKSVEVKKTKVKMKTEFPVFNKRMEFKVPNNEFMDSSVTFKIFDYDKYGTDVLLCYLPVYMKDLNVVSILNRHCKFYRNLLQEENVSIGMGQICLILKHSIETGLSLTILEIKNLYLKSHLHYSNVFITVDIIWHKHSYKTIILKKKQTKSCHYSPFPYFNDTFLFSDIQARILKCEICIKVWLNGKFKIATCIAYLILGSKTFSKSGKLHWENMLDNPRRPIARWHDLMNPYLNEI